MLGVQELGYSIMSTGGTGKHLKANGIECEIVLKIQEGRPNIGDMVKNGEIAMMLITSTGLRTSQATASTILFTSCLSQHVFVEQGACVWCHHAICGGRLQDAEAYSMAVQSSLLLRLLQ